MAIRFSSIMSVLLLFLQTQELPGRSPGGPDGNAIARAGDADSILTVRLSEIVVTATRSRIALHNSPSPVVVVRLDDQLFQGASRLSSALQTLPGAVVRDLGGGAGIKTLSVRGMSPSHTLVLLNGVRLNSSQNGLLDLGLWVPDGLDRVEYVRGGQSALYGTDAVAGALNVRTREGADSLRVSLQGTAGSYGLGGGGLAVSGGTSGLHLSAGAAHEQALGNYSYVARVGDRRERRERSHARYRLTNLHAGLQSRLSASARISLHSFFHDGWRESPGPVVTASYRDASLRDREFNTILQTEIAADGATLDLSAHYQRSGQHYVDRTPLSPIDAAYENRRWNLAAQWTQAVGRSLVLLAGAESGHAVLTSEELRAGVSRWSRSLCAGAEIAFRQPFPFVARTSLYPMIRFDGFSDSHEAVSPRLGANLWLTPDGELQIRGSLGLSFRVPNFNELYWIDGGNPDLRHERAVTADLGAAVAFEAGGRHSVELGLFDIAMRDRIAGWPPVNVSRSRNRGVELSWQWDPAAILSSVILHGSYTSAQNLSASDRGRQMPFVPRWQVTAAAGGRVAVLDLGITGRFVSRRYTTMDEAEALSIDPYFVADAELSTGIAVAGIRARGSLLVENVFDRAYEVMKGYPMPLRSFRIRCLLAY